MQFIVSVDIGTTTIRACLFGSRCELLETAEERVEVEISGQEEWELRVEIDPDKLFDQFLRVVRKVLLCIPAEAKVSMAICCQRNSFVYWQKSTLRTLHKIVCWNDGRALKTCKEWNTSYTIKALNSAGFLLHLVTRQSRFMAARMLQFLSAMVSHRAIVTLKQNAEIASLLKSGDLSFGCLDTWLLSRLSGGDVQVAEASSVSSTGMFDPFINSYNHTILRLIGFPRKVLPEIVDSVGTGEKPLATVEERHLGRKMDVVAVLADQQSALFGSGGWEESDVKISLGTGTFVDMNTGERPHASMNGLYPLVGWRIDGVPTFVAEGNDHDTAVLLRWAQNIGLFSDVSETSEMAVAAGSSHGVVFVPAFGGLQTPINDVTACCGFMGLRPDTNKQQMVRAILESIAFRVFQIFETMRNEVRLRNKPRIRICGGVAANDFVCQSISDMVNHPIERVTNGGLVACSGVALLAGTKLGMWSQEELPSLVSVERTFIPSEEGRIKLQRTYQLWLRAVQRCSKFYE